MSDGFNNLKKAHENMRNGKGYVVTQSDVLDTINHVVEQAERISALEQQQWVSVEERLPENEEPGVYLTLQYRYRDDEARQKYGYERARAIRWHNPGDAYFLGESRRNNPVTHWMPLPAPPSQEQESGE